MVVAVGQAGRRRGAPNNNAFITATPLVVWLKFYYALKNDALAIDRLKRHKHKQKHNALASNGERDRTAQKKLRTGEQRERERTATIKHNTTRWRAV